MNDVTSVLRNLPYFVALKGTDDTSIKNAEATLGLHFSDEYITYLKEFGVVSAGGHEFTGICASPRLNVVDVTLSERANNPDVPNDWYVIEQANIDGIVIWQNQKGEVYQIQSCCDSIKITNSIVEYITSN